MVAERKKKRERSGGVGGGDKGRQMSEEKGLREAGRQFSWREKKNRGCRLEGGGRVMVLADSDRSRQQYRERENSSATQLKNQTIWFVCLPVWYCLSVCNFSKADSKRELKRRMKRDNRGMESVTERKREKEEGMAQT